jgi:hypothetical protein
MKVISFYNQFNIFMVVAMASSLISLPFLCLPLVAATFSLASCWLNFSQEPTQFFSFLDLPPTFFSKNFTSFTGCALISFYNTKGTFSSFFHHTKI